MDLQRLLQTAGIGAGDIADLEKVNQALSSIEYDYAQLYSHLSAQAAAMTTLLQSVENVHAVRTRLKKSEQLLADLLDRKAREPQTELGPQTYTSLCTDLVSVLVLYRNMASWREIHDFVTETWHLTEAPAARVFPGDPLPRAAAFERAGCEVYSGPYVPSVTYRVSSDVGKRRTTATIDVRSVMDEAFSLCHNVGGAERSSPVAAHYAEIMRFVASLGMKVSAAADHIGAVGGTEDAEEAPEPHVSVGTGADDLASTRPVWIRRSPAKRSTTEGDRQGDRSTGNGRELQATARLTREQEGPRRPGGIRRCNGHDGRRRDRCCAKPREGRIGKPGEQ